MPITQQDQKYLARCLQLAALATTAVEPNPYVGALLVAKNRIIGEGFHQGYGLPHAEVHAIASVSELHLLTEATLYVNLEPCNHHGKTPPCSSLILENRIPRVVIGMADPNHSAAGGAAVLRDAGVEVVLAEDSKRAVFCNRHFLCNKSKNRTYISLKWAESANGIIGKSESRLMVSGEQANRYVHMLRAAHSAIMIGKQTAQTDNPALSLRHYPGRSPLPIVLDSKLELSRNLKLFERELIVVNTKKEGVDGLHTYLRAEDIHTHQGLVTLIGLLYTKLGIGSILVEGGRALLQSFIDAELYDEIHLLKSDSNLAGDVLAPVLPKKIKFAEPEILGNDTLFTKFVNNKK